MSCPFAYLNSKIAGSRPLDKNKSVYAAGSFIPRKCAKNDRNDQLLYPPSYPCATWTHTRKYVKLLTNFNLSWLPSDTLRGQQFIGWPWRLDGARWPAAVAQPLAPPLATCAPNKWPRGLLSPLPHHPITPPIPPSTCRSTQKSWLPFVVAENACECSPGGGLS